VVTVLVIMGNVGSGKTTVAKELSKEGFTYLGIDMFYPKEREAEWYKDRKFLSDTYGLLFAEAEQQIKAGKNIVLESTGAPQEFRKGLKKLEEIPRARLVRFFLNVPIMICKKILQLRKSTSRENVPLKWVSYVAKRLREIDIKYDFKLDGKRPTKEIVKEILELTI
tara:strand:+ start:3484 stop:3984 length:501 start_codon:yes stop_codon:yes gene_type:complete